MVALANHPKTAFKEVKMDPLKIAIIGAGSSYTPEIIEEIHRRRERFPRSRGPAHPFLLRACRRRAPAPRRRRLQWRDPAP